MFGTYRGPALQMCYSPFLSLVMPMQAWGAVSGSNGCSARSGASDTLLTGGHRGRAAWAASGAMGERAGSGRALCAEGQVWKLGWPAVKLGQ